MESVENIVEKKQTHLDILIDRSKKMMKEYEIMSESRIQLEDYKNMTTDELAERRKNKHRAAYFDALGRNLSLILNYLPGDNKVLSEELRLLLHDGRRNNMEKMNIPKNFIHTIDELAERIITKAKAA